jgi:hypothetical protein
MNEFYSGDPGDEHVERRRECIVCGQPLAPDGRCSNPQETLCTMTDEGSGEAANHEK